MVGIAAKSWSEQSTVIFESRQIHWHFLGQLEMLVTLVTTTSKAKKMASKAKKSSLLLSLPGSSWTLAIIIKMTAKSHQALAGTSRVPMVSVQKKWKQVYPAHHHLPAKDKSFYNFGVLLPFSSSLYLWEPIVFFIAKIIKKLYHFSTKKNLSVVCVPLAVLSEF